MRVPEQVLCDFCHKPIDITKPWPTITYPLTREQREELAPKEIPQPLASMLMLRSPVDLVPLKITVECCAPCLDASLEIVKNVVASRVDDAIEERRRQASTIGARE